VASPAVYSSKDIWKDIINPALQGTKNILNACKKAGTVKKFIYTSSLDAVDTGGKHNGLCTEEDWNELAVKSPKDFPYMHSKVMAEREAIKFVEELPTSEKFDLVRLCIGAVWGPQLSNTVTISNSVICSVLNGDYPGVPKRFIHVIDAVDAARAHVDAMENPTVSGRYLVVNEQMWLSDMCKKMKELYPKYPIPTSTLPNPLVYIASTWDTRLGTWNYLRANLGNATHFSNEKIKKDLKFEFTPLDKTLKNTADSLIEKGMVKRRA